MHVISILIVFANPTSPDPTLGDPATVVGVSASAAAGQPPITTACDVAETTAPCETGHHLNGTRMGNFHTVNTTILLGTLDVAAALVLIGSTVHVRKPLRPTPTDERRTKEEVNVTS